MRHSKKDKDAPQVALAGGMGTVAVPHTHHHPKHARRHHKADAQATTTAPEQNLAPEATDDATLATAPVESTSTAVVPATTPVEAVGTAVVPATRTATAPDAEDVLAYSGDEIVADQPLAEATDFSAEDDYEASIPKHEANAFTNIWGIIGFAVSIFAICGGWWLFLGWIPWLVGLVISFIAVFRPPRAFAIAGLSISGAYFIVWMILLGMGIV